MNQNKRSGKEGSADSEESVERRASTERKTEPSGVTVTQSTGQTTSALFRIREVAKKSSTVQFNNLFSHLTQGLLEQSFASLRKQAASGIDGVSWEDYAEQHQDHIKVLVRKLHTGKYYPQASKRVWLSKEDGSKRPIGISVLEDKIVQKALCWILQSIYEEDFRGFSYGFRPGRSQHNALDALYVAITQKKVGWVLDADIKGFYDNLDQEWLLMFITQRVSDKRVHELLVRMLRAGVEENGSWSSTEVGTPQGSGLSALLANVYLHYVLDLWVEQWRKQRARGEVYVVRYADDTVFCFQYGSEGETFRRQLHDRLQRFGLALHDKKTRLLEFGRFASSNRQSRGQGKPQTFDFLGFTHICEIRRSDGKFKLHRQSISKRLRAKVKEIKTQLLRCRSLKIDVQGRWLRSIVQGYYNYFGVPGNMTALNTFRTLICRAWIKSLRRRSHKAAKLNWLKMQRLINYFIPSVKSIHPYPNQRLRV